MRGLEEFPRLSKWLDNNTEEVADSTHHPWLVVGANDTSNKLVELGVEIETLEECLGYILKNNKNLNLPLGISIELLV